MEGKRSNRVHMQSGVQQGTVLGPLMFLIYINDIGDGVKSQIRLFAADSVDISVGFTLYSFNDPQSKTIL